jgi:hypothetical protein
MTHPLHEDPAVRDAALHLIAPSGDLHDKALLMHHDYGEWRLGKLREAAAKVRAGLDALDAAIAAADAINAAIRPPAEAGVAA